MENHRTIYTEVDEEITSIIERIKKTPVAEIALVVPRRSFLSQSIVNLKLLKNQSEKFGKKVLLVTRDSLCRSLAEKVGLPTGKKLDPDVLKHTEIDTLAPRVKQSFSEADNPVTPTPAFSKPDVVDLSSRGPSSFQAAAAPSSAERKIPVGMYPRYTNETKPPAVPEALLPNAVNDDNGTVKIREIRSNPISIPATNSMDMVKPGISRPPAIPPEERIEIKKPVVLPSQPQIMQMQSPGIPQPARAGEDILQNRVRISDVIQAALGKNDTDLSEIDREGKKDFAVHSEDSGSSQLTANVGEQKKSALSSPPRKTLTRDAGLSSRQPLRVIGKGEIRKVVLLPKASVRIMWGFLLALICVISLTAVFVLPKAEVTVTPKKEMVSADLEVQSSIEQAKLEADKQVIPSREVEEKVQDEREFMATGTARSSSGGGNRVTGSIAVYNEFSSANETFVPKTRFMTEDGLVFRSVTSVRIPGYTKSGGKVVPGRTVIEVIADKEGDEYLVAEGQKLSVPGLQGGDRYGKIYAMVEEPMEKPGAEGEKTVTAADIKKAREELQLSLEEKGKALLMERSDGFKAHEQSVVLEGIKFESSKAVGAGVETFTVKAEAVARGVVYNTKDLESVGEAYLVERARENTELAGALTAEVRATRYDKVRKSATMDVHVEKEGVKKLDSAELKKNILGLSGEEARDKLKSLEDVSDAEINLWPFWVKNIPQAEDKLQIRISGQ